MGVLMESKAGKPLRLSVSGGLRLFTSTGDEVRLPLNRDHATLAYLAFSDTSNTKRSKIAGMLWSEKDDKNALTSFRQVALHLTNFSADYAPGFVETTKFTIKLDRSIFTSELDILNEPVSNENSPDFAVIPEPNQMLEDLDGTDEVFDEWLRSWRVETGQKLRAALEKTLSNVELNASIRNDAAKALARIEPANEVAARHLIEVEFNNKNAAGMIRVYQRLWDALAEDWDEEPSADLQEFFVEKRIALGEVSAPTDQARYRVDSNSVKGRRELLTVLVARIVPSSNSSLIDLEEFEERTGVQKRFVIKKLEEYGGITSTGVGGEIFGVFGATSTEEDDIQKALDAALEIETALESENQKSSAGLKFSYRIGIDTGVVYLRISEDRTILYDVFGPPISNALELSRRPDGPYILATELSVRRLHSQFSFAEQPSVGSNGERVPVQALLGKQGASFLLSGEAWHSQDTFVGRTSFMSDIEASWKSAQKRQLERVVVMGEPGVGKTRLVTEFIRQKIEPGQDVHFVRCRRQDRSAPLESMYALDQSLNGNGAEDVGGAPAKLEARLINALSQRQIIVIFDDWQWADDASRSMLGKFIATLQDHPILFLFTIRGSTITDENLFDVKPISISNMNMDEVIEIAEKLLGWRPEAKRRQYIYNKSGGNPFFIEEICRTFLNNLADDPDDLTGDDLPGSMQAMMVSRFEGLDTDLQKIVKATAIYGDGLSFSLLEKILGQTIDERKLTYLVEIGLLASRSTGDPLYFKHGITFDIIYNTIGLAERRSLHAQFASELEAGVGAAGLDEISEQLAFHYRGAGEFEKAVIHAIRAGDKALKLSSLDSAKAQYTSALDLIDQCEPSEDNRRRWLNVAMRWGLPCIYAPARDQIPVLQKAVQIAREFNDTIAMAVVNHWIGYIQLVIGDHSDAIKVLTIAEDLARIGNHARLESDIIATRGFAHAGRCDYVRATRDIEIALAAKDQNPGNGQNAPVFSSYARATLAVVKSDQGDFKTAHEMIAFALDRVKRFNHEIESSICNMGSAILLWQGRWPEALDLSHRSCKRSEIVNSPYLINMARSLYGYSRWRDSGDTTGIDILCASAERLWTTQMRFYISFCYGWVSDACANSDRRTEAYAAAERTLELAKFGDPIGAAMACRSLAMLTASEPNSSPDDQFEKASLHLDAAINFANHRNSVHEKAVTALHRARLNAVFGKPDQALEAIDETVPQLRTLDMQWHHERAEHMQNEIQSGRFINDPSRITEFLL